MNDLDLDAALERRARRIDAMPDEEAIRLVDRPEGLRARLALEAGLSPEQAEDALGALLGLSDLRSLLLAELCRRGGGEIPPVEGVSHAEMAMLRPMAETLAMLDGNAFLGAEPTAARGGVAREWWEWYAPMAKAVFDANGGLSGWASEASFAKAWAPLMPWAARAARAAAGDASGQRGGPA